jgi:hypothetical protein
MNILLVVASLLAASGDPYILRVGTDTVLSGDQNTALQTLMASRFAGVTYSSVYRIDCHSEDDVRPWQCDVDYWETPSWATIRASLISQVPWVPGMGGALNTWLVRTTKMFVASAAWRTHAQTIWADLLASPMLRLTYTRTDGTGDFVAHLDYKRSMNQSAIATAVNAGETLMPDGVMP